MNEWYARDVSRKISTAKRTKGKSGKYVASFAPYGYRKSETDKDVWEIDPEAAEVVRRIFRMTIEGYGITQIALRLQRDKIYAPAYHQAQNGTGAFKNRVFDDPYRWQSRVVDIIIGRMEYKGCMVNLRTQKASFKDKRSKQIPKDEWLVFEGKHEPIVDADTWQAANDIRQKKRRNKYDSLGEPHPLTGLLFCATCKSKMHHNRGVRKETGSIKNYYTCKRSKLGNEFCTCHRIKGDAVEALVLETLQRVCKYAANNEADFTRQINEMFSSQQADTVKSQRKKLKISQTRHAELDKLIQRIYEDNIAERISDKRFEILSNQYEQEQTDLEQIISQLQTDLDSYDDSADRASKFLELTYKYKDRYQDFAELTPTMLHEFVDRIEIHERADRRHIITTQKIDIYLNFIGTYTPPINEADIIQPSPEEIKAQEIRMAKLTYQREYKKRRAENDGKPLGHFTGQRLSGMTPEEKAAYEAARKQRLKEYHAKWYQDNKQRMKAEKEAKRIILTPEELAAKEEERKRKRREYEREYNSKNRERLNTYKNEWRRNKRKQNNAAART
jgi:hypothetical protein